MLSFAVSTRIIGMKMKRKTVKKTKVLMKTMERKMRMLKMEKRMARTEMCQVIKN